MTTASMVAWAPNGARLASAHYGGRIKIWNTTDGKLGRTIDATGPLYTIAWSHNGKWLAAGLRGRYPAGRHLGRGDGRQVRELRGHTGYVNGVAWAPDDTLLASASDDKRVIVWEASTGRQVRALQNHTARVEQVSFSPDGKTLASGVRGYDDQAVGGG